MRVKEKLITQKVELYGYIKAASHNDDFIALAFVPHSIAGAKSSDFANEILLATEGKSKKELKKCPGLPVTIQFEVLKHKLVRPRAKKRRSKKKRRGKKGKQRN